MSPARSADDTGCDEINPDDENNAELQEPAAMNFDRSFRKKFI